MNGTMLVSAVISEERRTKQCFSTIPIPLLFSKLPPCWINCPSAHTIYVCPLYYCESSVSSGKQEACKNRDTKLTEDQMAWHIRMASKKVSVSSTSLSMTLPISCQICLGKVSALLKRWNSFSFEPYALCLWPNVQLTLLSFSCDSKG